MVARRTTAWVRSLTVRERLFLSIAIVGACIAAVGGATGAVALTKVGNERAARADDNALAGFDGCRRSNQRLRPAVRDGLLTLRGLITFVNAGATTRQLAEAPPFAEAPARLSRSIKLLRAQDCPRLYPDGFRVWVERGRRPLVPGRP